MISVLFPLSPSQQGRHECVPTILLFCDMLSHHLQKLARAENTLCGRGCTSRIILLELLCSWFVIYAQYNVFLFLPCPLALGGEFRGPMGKFPKQPGSYILGMCLFTHGYHVHGWLWGCLCKNHTWTPLHGLLHPRGTGKNSLLWC